jgi:hypothetical protein
MTRVLRNAAVVMIAALGLACSAKNQGGVGGASAGGVGATVPPSTAGTGGAAMAQVGTGGKVSTGGVGAVIGSGGSVAGGSGVGGGSAAMATGGAGGAGGTGGMGTGGMGTGGMGSGGSPATKGTLPPVTSVEMDGPYAVTVDQNAGANSWVFRPTDLGKDGVKHPIFVWGTGATSVPMQYMDHFTRVASHGFVVISPNTGSVDAAALKASLDWLLAENDKMGSVYYQKLDATKIAMGGHSLGSVSTFDQEAMETRLTTTIHIAGGSFDGMGSSKVKTPTAYMCGQMDLDIASPQCATDYQNATKPTYFVQLSGVDHISAARSALPGIVAWLRWHLAGETDRKSMFIGTGCDFCKGIWANAMSKNW